MVEELKDGTMEFIDVEDAAAAALRGEKVMVGVFNEGVGLPLSVTLAINRADMDAFVTDFRNNRVEKWRPAG